MNGKVKFYNRVKNFGFIAGEDGKEYFVHISGLNEGVKLFENDAVTFDVEEGDRGPKAVNVSKTEGSAAPVAEEKPAEEVTEVQEAAEDVAEESAEEESAEETKEE